MSAIIVANFEELIEAARGEVAVLSTHLEALKRKRPRAEDLARHLYRERRARNRYFSNSLFGEPGWDMLLDLYIARCEGKTRSTKSACIGAAAPQTTALRWLMALEDAKLIRRWHVNHDERLTLVAITDEGFERMTAFLERVVASIGT